MNASATAWIEKLPRRWARNATILAAVVTLIRPEPHAPESSPWIMWGLILGSALANALLLGVATYLIGIAARRHLRTLRNMSDKAAHKAVAWLPLRYFVWGLLFGFLVLFSDFLFQWGNLLPYTTAYIESNITEFIGAMFPAAAITTTVGFISRTALRKRLGGSHGNAEDGSPERTASSKETDIEAPNDGARIIRLDTPFHKRRRSLSTLKVIAPTIIVLLAVTLAAEYFYELTVLGQKTFEPNNLRITVISGVLTVLLLLYSGKLSMRSFRQRPLPELPTTLGMLAAKKNLKYRLENLDNRLHGTRYDGLLHIHNCHRIPSGTRLSLPVCSVFWIFFIRTAVKSHQGGS
jgi:hypothetical protein